MFEGELRNMHQKFLHRIFLTRFMLKELLYFNKLSKTYFNGSFD